MLTGRSNDEVAAGRPGEPTAGRTLGDIDLSAAVAAERESFIEPMLATPVDRPFSGTEWLFELKLDGYRLEAVVGGGKTRLWTRNHQDGAAWFPAFAALAPDDWLGARDAVVDGEMVALDSTGRPDFGLLQELAGMKRLGVRRREGSADATAGSRDGTLVYHPFDLLHLDGWSLLQVPLLERKRLLRLQLRDHASVRYVGHVLEHGEDFHSAVARQGLEGSIAKRIQGRYRPGIRSREWLKVKVRREQELVVIGYQPGHGSHADLGSLLVATHESEGWRFAGHVGSGLDGRTREELRELLERGARPGPVVSGVPAAASTRYCQPEHVIRAEFAEWTPDGLLRQAVYKGRQIGRDPMTVSRELTLAVPTGRPAEAGGAPGRCDDDRAAGAGPAGGRWDMGDRRPPRGADQS